MYNQCIDFDNIKAELVKKENLFNAQAEQCAKHQILIRQLTTNLNEKSDQVNNLLSHINSQNQDKVLDDFQTSKNADDIANLKKIIQTLQHDKVKLM